MKGLVRHQVSHFMCAVSNNGVWNYIDDLKDKILTYDNLNKLYEDRQSGWFFCFYVIYNSNNEISCDMRHIMHQIFILKL